MRARLIFAAIGALLLVGAIPAAAQRRAPVPNTGMWSIGGSIGAGIVYHFGIRQLITQRRIDFRKQQLAEFYAPLAGMHQQVRATAPH